MDKGKIGYMESTRVIMAKSMDIPPDDIDMLTIFKCAQRAIEEKIENNLEEYVLAPSNKKEIQAVIGEIGETIIPMMFNGEYPFEKFVDNYAKWYEEGGFIKQFLKKKLEKFLLEEDEEM